MQSIRPEDDGSHVPPPDADESWQESWFLGWYDPARRAGGFHHLGLQPIRQRADLDVCLRQLRDQCDWHADLRCG